MLTPQLWKLDLIFVFVGFLGYIFKYLDQVNIVSRYIGQRQSQSYATCTSNGAKGSANAGRSRLVEHDQISIGCCGDPLCLAWHLRLV